MASPILTISSTITCTHGGQAVLLTGNTSLNVDSVPALIETDVHPVVGCPFTIGTKYSPCIRIEWSAGSPMTKVNGTPVLVRTSVGKCYSAEGAVQGTALIVNTQMRVQG
jgi:hypothetical protein